jgi:hypothetical protein
MGVPRIESAPTPAHDLHIVCTLFSLAAGIARLSGLFF